MSGPSSEDVPSPCVGICRLNQDRVCLGCGRALEEIAAWPGASAARRREIRNQAEQRLHAMQQRQPSKENDEGSA